MSTSPSQTADELTLTEEDAYAHIVQIANERATDTDKRKLIKAGLLAIEDKQNDKPDPTPAPTRKTPPAVPQSSRVRARAIRFLIERANGENFRKAIRAAEVEWFDIQRYRWSDAQFAVAMDFIERERHNLIAAKASDALESLIDGDAASESRNTKAVMFALERLKRDEYADAKKNDGGNATGKGGGITYNITFQGVQPPNLCGNCVGTSPTQPIIDIKSE